MEHKQDVINQQMQLKRVADITIDLFGLSAVTSRASAALDAGTATADHEALLCRAFTVQASRRIKQNLADLANATESDNNLTTIANDMFVDGRGYIPAHPSGV